MGDIPQSRCGAAGGTAGTITVVALWQRFAARPSEEARAGSLHAHQAGSHGACDSVLCLNQSLLTDSPLFSVQGNKVGDITEFVQ